MSGRPSLFLAALAVLLLSASAHAQDTPFRGETHEIRRLELKGARVVDAIRLISELSKLNVVSTQEAGEKVVTLYLQDVTAGHAVETLCKVAGLWFRRDEETQTFRVMTTSEFQKDYVVYRQDDIRVFTLRHPNAIVIGSAIEDLYGYRVRLSLGVEEEEAIDLPVGMGALGGTSTSGARFGLDDPSQRRRSFQQRDRALRRGGYGGYRDYRGGRGMRDAERLVDEELTADQIDRLQKRVDEAKEATAEELRGISRRDPMIYVTVNRQHNLVVVRTSDNDAMKQISQLIAELDRPTPQVLLEMKILELRVGDSFRSIFDIEYAGGTQSSGPDSSQPANPLLLTADTASRNVLGIGNFDLEDSTLIYQFLNDNVRARLQLLATDNRINILSTPIVLASNNRPARMFVGEERILVTGVNTDVVTSATGPTTTVVEPVTETRDIGNTLIVVPKINADRTVTLFILQDSSSVLEDSATIPVTSAEGGVTDYPIDTVETANLQATVVAKDGMTLAVGGLIRVELVDREEKVPVLGDIPVIRFFFRKKVKARDKSEVVLLIRPRVLFTPAEADEVTRKRIKELSDHPYTKKGDQAYEEDLDDLRDKAEKEKEKDRKKREKRRQKEKKKELKEREEELEDKEKLAQKEKELEEREKALKEGEDK
ncbi:MAG: type II secretion system protein GspD [Planctomycetota bacterium]|jgi:general secretion pathway protein D